MKSELGLESIARNLTKNITAELDKVGVLYRIFFRVKSQESIERKIVYKEYKKQNKKITDIIGIRITLYFQDDVSIVYNHLKTKKNFDHESTDVSGIEDFKPIRRNLTYNFEEENASEAVLIYDLDSDVIDTKYEIQLRTVLSEGWHEVEHDLRYKCIDDWKQHDDLNRNLNGILATLETSEFSMLQLFSNLSHRHYLNGNLEALIKTQFRIRLSGDKIGIELLDYVSKNRQVIKAIHRINRGDLLSKLINSKYSLPLTIDNFIYLCNYIYIKDENIFSIAGSFINEELDIAFDQAPAPSPLHL